MPSNDVEFMKLVKIITYCRRSDVNQTILIDNDWLTEYGLLSLCHYRALKIHEYASGHLSIMGRIGEDYFRITTNPEFKFIASAYVTAMVLDR